MTPRPGPPRPAGPGAADPPAPVVRRLRRAARPVRRGRHPGRLVPLRGQRPHPALPGSPHPDRRPRHGPGHRHGGCRPLGRRRHRPRRLGRPPLPRLRRAARGADRPGLRRGLRRGRRHHGRPRPYPADRRHPRPDDRAAGRRRTDQRQLRQAGHRHRAAGPRLGRVRRGPRHGVDRRGVRRADRAAGTPDHLRPAAGGHRRQPPGEQAGRTAGAPGPRHRLRPVRRPRRPRRRDDRRARRRGGPRQPGPEHGAQRHHRRRGRRHPLTGGRVRVLGTVAGALFMQLITAVLTQHNVHTSYTQLVEAVIICFAVYASQERGTR